MWNDRHFNGRMWDKLKYFIKSRICSFLYAGREIVLHVGMMCEMKD